MKARRLSCTKVSDFSRGGTAHAGAIGSNGGNAIGVVIPAAPGDAENAAIGTASRHAATSTCAIRPAPTPHTTRIVTPRRAYGARTRTGNLPGDISHIWRVAVYSAAPARARLRVENTSRAPIPGSRR